MGIQIKDPTDKYSFFRETSSVGNLVKTGRDACLFSHFAQNSRDKQKPQMLNHFLYSVDLKTKFTLSRWPQKSKIKN